MADQQGTPGQSFSESKSPVPLYHRLYVILRDQLTSGVYRAGDLLPPELDLAKTYGVSRVTAKRALDELAKEGFVERSRGRGTVVTDRRLELISSAPLIASIDILMSNLETISQETEVRVIYFEYVRPPAHIADTLRTGHDHEVQKAVRLRFFKGKPVALSTSYIVPEVARTISREDFERKSLINLITEAGKDISLVQQTISARLADERTAGLLNIPSGSPLVRIQRTFFVDEDTPVDSVEILYPAERFEYQVTLKR